MKKYFILTSLLALTACFGGGGNSGSGGGTIGGSDTVYIDAVRNSNANITGMTSNSKYQVTKYVANKLGDDASSVNLTRSATIRSAFVPSPQSGNIEYDTAHRLVELARWLVNEDTEKQDIINLFEKSPADKNDIKLSLKLLDDMYCFVGGDAEKTADRIIEKRQSFQEPFYELDLNTQVLDLKDAKFKVIPTSGVITDLVFHTDDKGEVTSIEYLNAAQIMLDHDGSDLPMGEMERNGKTNTFTAHFGNPETPDEQTTMPVDYISYTKQLGLKYSEFGVLRANIGTDQDPVYYDTPFIAGHDSKNIENPLEETGSKKFHGTARATVSYNDGAGDIPLTVEQQGKPTSVLIDNNATLTFAVDTDNKTTQTLAANFADWASVEAIKSSDGTNQFKVMESHVETTSPYYLTDSPDGLQDGKMPGEDSEHMNDSMIMQTGYYGDNNIPSEAVGLVQYQHVEQQQGHEHHVNVDLGFGGKIEK